MLLEHVEGFCGWFRRMFNARDGGFRGWGWGWGLDSWNEVRVLVDDGDSREFTISTLDTPSASMVKDVVSAILEYRFELSLS